MIQTHSVKAETRSEKLTKHALHPNPITWTKFTSPSEEWDSIKELHDEKVLGCSDQAWSNADAVCEAEQPSLINHCRPVGIGPPNLQGHRHTIEDGAGHDSNTTLAQNRYPTHHRVTIEMQ
jgi:hypothetical protein